MISRQALPAILLLLSVHSAVAVNEDWADVLGKQLQILEKEPGNLEARKEAWRAAMRLGLFEEAANLGAPLDSKEQRALEGDRIALTIRHGIIDRNTMRGPQKFSRLDSALTVTDQLAADFLAGKALDTEDHRRLTDRLSALANRRRAADAVSLYESFIARGLPVPEWTKRDIAGSYLELRQPQHAASLYYEVVSANPDDFDANLGLFYALVESEELDAATQHIDTFAAPCLSADIAMANTTASA